MKKSWSRGLVKSRLKNGRESRSRETEVGEKIAVTTWCCRLCYIDKKKRTTISLIQAIDSPSGLTLQIN